MIKKYAVKISKPIFLVCVCFSTSETVVAQNEREENISPQKLAVNVWLQNMAYWRGAPMSVFSVPSAPTKEPSPVLVGEVSYGGAFRVGIWTAHSFDATGYKNASYYVNYTVSRFTLTLWDSYTLSNPKATNFFDYANASTQHYIDLSVGYKFKKIPLDLFLASVIYGVDGAVVNGHYQNRYSTYFRADYTFRKVVYDADISTYASVGGALNDIDGTDFFGTPEAQSAYGITEVGITVTKTFPFFENMLFHFREGWLQVH